jgi:hypothetical protein
VSFVKVMEREGALLLSALGVKFSTEGVTVAMGLPSHPRGTTAAIDTGLLGFTRSLTATTTVSVPGWQSPGMVITERAKATWCSK